MTTDKELEGLENLARREALVEATKAGVVAAERVVAPRPPEFAVGDRLTINGVEFKIVYLRPQSMSLEIVGERVIPGSGK